MAKAKRIGEDDGPKPGDIVLFARADGMNRVITWVTRSRFYHVALFSRESHVLEARPQGVLERDVRGSEGTPFTHYIPAPEGRGEEALAWAKTKIGSKYDRVDILVILLDRVFKHLRFHYAPDGKFCCGEFVARAYEEAGVTLFRDLKPEAVVPGDFERLKPRPAPDDGAEEEKGCGD